VDKEEALNDVYVGYLAGDKVEPTPELIESLHRTTAFQAYIDMEKQMRLALELLSSAQTNANHIMKVQKLFGEATFVMECKEWDEFFDTCQSLSKYTAERIEKTRKGG